jgi:hypothetical protein
MLPSFQMSVPADARYRVLAPEVAGKYAALAGCSDADAKAVLADVERAAADLAGAGADIALVFSTDVGGLHVTLTCGPQSLVVRRVLPAK